PWVATFERKVRELSTRTCGQASCIDDLTRSTHCREIEHVAADLHQQEVRVVIETGRGPLRRTEVSLPQSARGAAREVMAPSLRPHALVEVLVAAEADVHPVLNEQRLERRAYT